MHLYGLEMVEDHLELEGDDVAEDDRLRNTGKLRIRISTLKFNTYLLENLKNISVDIKKL